MHFNRTLNPLRGTVPPEVPGHSTHCSTAPHFPSQPGCTTDTEEAGKTPEQAGQAFHISAHTCEMAGHPQRTLAEKTLPAGATHPRRVSSLHDGKWVQMWFWGGQPAGHERARAEICITHRTKENPKSTAVDLGFKRNVK